ncbi:MAG: cytidylate kinase-like family protein [Parasporobacterium sp.]|nr:cytidylate kinase-like family protein [Parasporobacterium sp.]
MKVITITRQYGAGGHTIGRAVAKELGIEFYDKDIIRKTAVEMGLDIEEIKKAEEKLSKRDSFVRAITPVSYDYRETLFEIESKVILELAGKGPCVILGRCAGEVLRHEDIDYLNVYLYADATYRAQRAGEILNSRDINVVTKTMKKEDAARRAHFHYFTGQNINECEHWHMMLDTGALGFETCTRLICEAAKN